MGTKAVISCLFILFLSTASAQDALFTHQDSIRGSITKERAWWNLKHYDLDLAVSIKSKSIKGSNTITYEVLSTDDLIQIDLQNPMKITAVLQDKENLSYVRDGNAYYISLKKEQIKGAVNSIIIHYEGSPKISKNPPWDDGFTWKKDKNGKDFIATSCQGGGASIWWPCKDHMYDEPDNGMRISITAPKHLTGVANGRLKKETINSDDTKTAVWEVVNPINNYGVNVNIGDYTRFSEEYKGENGVLDCDYYVLTYNLDKAKKQFKQTPKMLAAFESWFGPYPFYEDSFKLVEVPYLGMEHQSSVTYGNAFENGYLGNDLSGTGWGLKFDYILIHESGHEWFANNITYKDIADMWVHEAFTTYSENLYLDYHFGTKASNEYVQGLRRYIKNDKPIIGPYDVNKSGSGDMYFKGANMIHTLRQLANDDTKWKTILRGLNKKFYHQTVTSKQIEDFLSEGLGMNLQSFFDQYLRDSKIPTFTYKKEGNTLLYKWTNAVSNLHLPIRITLDKEVQWITPSDDWQKIALKNKDSSFIIDQNFYIDNKEVTN